MKKSHLGIYGPTASGKTFLCLEIANGLKVHFQQEMEIVNFDSCQFLNYLPSLTMKPVPSTFKEHLFGFVGPTDTKKYTAGDFVRHIEHLNHINECGKIFVGGSGFYLLCLLNGISNEQSIDSSIMSYIENRNIQQNYEKLCALEPNHGLHKNDSYRINNYLHYFLKHNKSIKESLNKPVIDKSNIFTIFLNPSKQWLHKNIELRTNFMFEKMVSEVNEFKVLHLDFKTNIIGYKEICEYIDGKITEQQAKERINLRTRQYTKTQKTFLKNKLTSDLVLDENYNINDILFILKNKLI